MTLLENDRVALSLDRDAHLKDTLAQDIATAPDRLDEDVAAVFTACAILIVRTGRCGRGVVSACVPAMLCI